MAKLQHFSWHKKIPNHWNMICNLVIFLCIKFLKFHSNYLLLCRKLFFLLKRWYSCYTSCFYFFYKCWGSDLIVLTAFYSHDSLYHCEFVFSIIFKVSLLISRIRISAKYRPDIRPTSKEVIPKDSFNS